MRLRTILTTITLIISTTLLIYHFIYISPINAETQTLNKLTVVWFLILVFVALSSFTSLIGVFFRRRFNQYGHPIKQFNSSLRQGILLATGVIFFFVLKMSHLDNPFTLSSTVLVLIFIEWYFRG